MNKFFWLTSLSLIVFEFQRATFGGDGRALLSLGKFRACLLDLHMISYNSFSAGWYVILSFILSLTLSLVCERKKFSLPILFF